MEGNATAAADDPGGVIAALTHLHARLKKRKTNRFVKYSCSDMHSFVLIRVWKEI